MLNKKDPTEKASLSHRHLKLTKKTSGGGSANCRVKLVRAELS